MQRGSLLLPITVVLIASQLPPCIAHAIAQGQEKPAAKTAHPVAKPSVPSADLKIQKATYGDLPDGTSIDVTEKVRSVVLPANLDSQGLGF